MDKLSMQVKNMSNNIQPIVGSTLYVPNGVAKLS